MKRILFPLALALFLSKVVEASCPTAQQIQKEISAAKSVKDFQDHLKQQFQLKNVIVANIIQEVGGNLFTQTSSGAPDFSTFQSKAQEFGISFEKLNPLGCEYRNAVVPGNKGYESFIVIRLFG